MAEKFLINSSITETRIGHLRGGRLIDLMIERGRGACDQPGAIFMGRVSKLAPGIDAAFVELGLGRAGLLPAAQAVYALAPDQRTEHTDETPAINRIISEGQLLPVQITRSAYKNKGALLSANLTLVSPLLVLAPYQPGVRVSGRIKNAPSLEAFDQLLAQSGCGLVVRTRAGGAGVSEQGLVIECRRLLKRWRDITEQIRAADKPGFIDYPHRPLLAQLIRNLPDAPCPIVADDAGVARDFNTVLDASGFKVEQNGSDLFSEHEIDDQIETALGRMVTLASGGSIVFDATEALTVIDVNAGGAAGGHKNNEQVAVQVNLAAAEEIALQVRLRNLSGLFAADFIHMQKKTNREAVQEALYAAFQGDPEKTSLSGMSRFGLIEFTRSRQGPSLAEILLTPSLVPQPVKSFQTLTCELGRRLEREAREQPGLALRITLCPELCDWLRGAGATLWQKIYTAVSNPLELTSDEACPRERIDITVQKKN